MLHRFRSSIMWKLVLFFTLTMLAIITCISVFSYKENSETLKRDSERFSSQILKQAILNLNRYYKEYESVFVILGGSNDFLRWIQTDTEDSHAMYKLKTAIESRYLNSYFRYHPEVLSVVMYNEGGKQFNYLGNSEGKLSLKLGYSLADEYDLSQIPLSEHALWFIKESHAYTNSTNREYPLSVMTFIKQFVYSGQTAYIAIDVSLDPTLQIMNEINLGYNASAMVVNSEGTIVAHPDKERMFERLESDVITDIGTLKSGSLLHKSSNQMYFFEELAGSDQWKVVISAPYEQMTQSAQTIRTATVAITLIGMMIALLFIIVISSRLTNRIKQLRRGMKITQLGKFDHRVSMKGRDEIADLAFAFNMLLERLQFSLEDLTEERMVRQQAVLSALQSQINSHFLYNALESINALSNLENRPEIGRIAVSLAKMLRYTSNYTETTVTLRHEIEHLRHYLYIIEILYGDMVQFDIEVDESVLDTACLKAIFQPLMENSIKHALNSDTSPILVQVQVERCEDQYVRVTCRDNGPGFTQQKIIELQEAMRRRDEDNRLKQMDRIGLLNVYYRLNVFCHQPGTGLSFGNRPDGGAEVSVVLPLDSEEEISCIGY